MYNLHKFGFISKRMYNAGTDRIKNMYLAKGLLEQDGLQGRIQGLP